MYKKIPNTNIASIIERYELTEDAQAILDPKMSPKQAIASLVDVKLYNDVIQFIAHALPMIDGIYWASESLALRLDEWDNPQRQTINSARQWLQQPNETNRIRANQLAERIGLEIAPAWIAKAVYWSGTGSIVAPELPAVMPPAFLYGHAIAATISIAAAVPAWKKGDIGYEKFYLKVIDLGIKLAEGSPLRIKLLTMSEEK
ncbi:MAG: hypothetical protein HRT54_22435 [Colwellia sp.]|nr:hypothetical protein [Colwellia sp.]